MSDTFGSIPIQPEPSSSPAPKRPEAPAHKRSVRMKRHRFQPGRPKIQYVLLFLAFLFAGYLATGFFGVPAYLQKKLPELFYHHTSLSLTTHKISFNPLTFDLQFSGVTVHDPSGVYQPLLDLKSANAAISPLSLVKGEFVATAVLLDTFRLNLVRSSVGNYNFIVADRKSAAGRKPVDIDLAAIPVKFSLNNISLSNGNLEFIDEPNANTHTVEKIQLSLPNLSNFSFQAQDYIRPSFSAIINGSPIELTGQAAFAGNSKDSDVSLKTELSCNFNAIDLNKYFAYLPFSLPFDLRDGKAAGSLKLTFTPANKNELLSIDFTMQATDVKVASSKEIFQLQVPVVQLEGAIQPLTGKTRLRRFEMRDPQTTISPAFTFAHFRALANLVSAKHQSANTSSGPEVFIDQLLADNGTVILSGEKADEVQSKWEAIQFSMKNYSNTAPPTKDQRATFRLLGEQTASRATFNYQGHINERLLPAGDLLLSNIAAKSLLPLIGLGDITAGSGTADVQGFLSFSDYPDLDIVTRVTVKEGVFTFNDLELVDNKHTWFSAPVTKIAGFQKEGKKLSLGSVFLKNSVLHLQTDNLPTIVRRIGGEKGNVAIEAMDFSGNLTLSDSSKKLPDLNFTDVSLQAINLARLESSSERDNLTLTARLGQKGELQAKGKVRLSSFITTLTTGFTGIESSTLLPWFGNNELLANASMLLAGKGTFSFPFVGYNGQLLLQDGNLTKKDSKNKTLPYFSWQEVNLQDFKYKSSPLQIAAAQATLLAPRMNWTYQKKSPHPFAALGSFLEKHVAESTPVKGKDQPLPAISIDKLVLTAGSIGLVDNRLSPAWTTEIGGLSGTFDQVSSSRSAPPSAFNIKGDFESESFHLSGKVNLFHFAKEGEAEMVIKEFPLASLKNVLKKKIDIDPAQGTVSVQDHTSWGDGVLKRNSSLVMRDVEPNSNKASSALPLALLKSQDNTFTLEVASVQPLQDTTPTPLIDDAISSFQKLVLKATVSPLLLAGGEFSELIGQEFIEFEPGKILLTEKGQSSLASFKNLLSTHPSIGLTIIGSADAADDAEAMKRDLEQAEIERVAVENQRRSAALQQATEEYLHKLAEKQKAKGITTPVTEQQIPKELSRRFAPLKPQRVEIDKSMLQNLANERARMIAELLIDSLALDPKRISLSKRVVINTEKETPGNRVLFTIETHTPAQEG